jgi:hypothetical protein
MAQANGVPPFVNKTMKFILRSPLHGLVSKSVVLFGFNGRKSGQPYTTPVSYSQSGEVVRIFTHAQWWKNLRGGAPVSLRLRGREVRGLAEPVADDPQAIAAELAEHLRQVPSDARWYGVCLDERGEPDADEVAKAVASVVMVRVRLG